MGDDDQTKLKVKIVRYLALDFLSALKGEDSSVGNPTSRLPRL